jgi:hypothetical protein
MSKFIQQNNVPPKLAARDWFHEKVVYEVMVGINKHSCNPILDFMAIATMMFVYMTYPEHPKQSKIPHMVFIQTLQVCVHVAPYIPYLFIITMLLPAQGTHPQGLRSLEPQCKEILHP